MGEINVIKLTLCLSAKQWVKEKLWMGLSVNLDMAVTPAENRTALRNIANPTSETLF
jgi:hypothetical protein